MAYSKKSVDFVKELFEKKRQKSEKERLMRIDEVYSACPEVASIDAALSSVANEIMEAISLGKESCAQRIEEIKEKNLDLQKRRAMLLDEKGFGAHYTDRTYDCPICKDTGYAGVRMCSCFRNAIILKEYEFSGLGNLLKKQNFESFSLDFYSGKDKDYMLENYNDLYNFAHNFDTDKRSFLLFGGTGLGKTHLSTSVAKYLIDNGYNVIYETAQNIFSDFEKDRFRDRFSGEEPISSKYLECDLLIIDDLGTEIVSAFSVSCLYNIINTRLNKDLPIIANTNLRQDEIRKLYQDRITSRLFGEFIIKRFMGEDIRKQKILK
ncbi:MAG: ATP-binding protein [Clostridia bacterium]|nr:ATP-binding protein [Clostridia bacterium]